MLIAKQQNFMRGAPSDLVIQKRQGGKLPSAVFDKSIGKKTVRMNQSGEKRRMKKSQLSTVNNELSPVNHK